MDLEELRALYKDAIGQPMPSIIEREVRYSLIEDEDGETMYAYYRYALIETAAAPRPSWRYASAIIGRLMRDQVPIESISWL